MVTAIADMIVIMIRIFNEGTHGFGFYSKTCFFTMKKS